jgi:hypothetical protein
VWLIEEVAEELTAGVEKTDPPTPGGCTKTDLVSSSGGVLLSSRKPLFAFGGHGPRPIKTAAFGAHPQWTAVTRGLSGTRVVKSGDGVASSRLFDNSR